MQMRVEVDNIAINSFHMPIAIKCAHFCVLPSVKYLAIEMKTNPNSAHKMHDNLKI